MTLRELKYQMLNETAQVIVFHKEGRMVETCHSLSNIESWEGENIYEIMPLLKSMRIAFEHIGNDIIDLPCVDFILQQRHGYYDFTFRAHPENPDHIVWIIKDQTRIYRYYQAIQQERNLLRLEKEYKDIGKSA